MAKKGADVRRKRVGISTLICDANREYSPHTVNSANVTKNPLLRLIDDPCSTTLTSCEGFNSLGNTGSCDRSRGLKGSPYAK